METAPRDVRFRSPIHPYTRALLSAVPDPDPDSQLDLTALMEGKASIPGEWPEPFTIDGEHDLGLINLGEGHYVRAHPDAGQVALLT